MTIPKNQLFEEPETEELLVGSSEAPENSDIPSFHDIHKTAEILHQQVHRKEKQFSDNFVVGLIPVIGPMSKFCVEKDTAMTALTQGVDMDSGKKFTTMGERMKFVAKHEGKALWEQGKTVLDVGLWAVGVGEVEALATVAKGADTAGKVGKGLKIAKEGGKVAGFFEKVGVKSVDRMAFKATETGVGVFKAAEKVERVHKVIGAAEIGHTVAKAGKEILNKTHDPDAKALLEAHNNEWTSMMANPETKKEIEKSYEQSDFKKLVDTEYTHMQDDPTYAQKVLDQIIEWQGQYQNANAKFEPKVQPQTASI
jgi:hypothetical protein